MNFQVGLQDASLPPGSLVAFAGKISTPDSSPEAATSLVEAWGWMVCDGRKLVASQYPELFAALGYLYGGQGDDFHIPDLAGQFLRGVGTSDAVKEDRIKAPGGEVDGVGSTQEFAVQDHVHLYTQPQEPMVYNQGKATKNVVQGNTPETDTSGPMEPTKKIPGKVKVSEFETRPENTLVYFLIKYTTKLPGYQPATFS